MPASIFAGSKVKTLKGTLSLNGGADVISSTVDPTSVAVDASPGSILLNTTSGKQYRKNDSGSSTNWTEVGAGTSGINYITNPTASTNTTGWSTYADAAGAAPVDGTGGSPTVTWTRSTTTPLRGAADFNFTKDAANRQGEGVATDITIDLADRAKVLTVTFDYEVLSGTYASGDLTVYLIADPSGTPVVIQPAGYTVQSATVGTTMRQIATFQTQATGQSYRVCFHVASTSASAYVLAIDNVICGPQTTVYGAPVTDWQSYTPTITNATGITSATGAFRRIGDSYHVRVAFSVPSQARTATTSWKISLPNNVTPDTTSAPDIGGTAVHGFYEVYGDLTGTANQYVQLDGVRVQSSGVFLAKRGTNRDLYDADFNSVGAAKYISADFTFKVVGLSSSVQMSNDTDTRVVAAQVRRATGQLIASTGTWTKVLFNSSVIDTHSSFDITTNNRYNVPVSGLYRLHGQLYWNTGTANTGDVTIAVYKIGSRVQQLSVPKNGTAGIEHGTPFSFLVQANAGDYLEIYVNQSVIASYNIAGDNTAAGLSQLNIERLSGPATIAASETVALRVKSTTTTIGSSPVTVIYSSKDYDSHSIYNTTTGIVTIPISGTWRIAASYWTQNTFTSGNNVSISVMVGSTEYILGRPIIPTAASVIVTSAGATEFYALAGTQVYILGSASISTSPFADNRSNWVTLSRVGN
jgi:hypothetical protein